MRTKVYWGLGVLIVLFIGAFVLLLTRPPETEPEEVYKPLTPSEKAEVDRNIQDTIDEAKQNEPPIAEDDHVHQPMKRTPGGDPNVVKDQTYDYGKSHYDKPLVHDAELFEKNPALAFKRELEARGHWAAEHIPPFPPDDLEAQAVARSAYMVHFMGGMVTGEEMWDAVLKKSEIMTRIRQEYGIASARGCDLGRFAWVLFSSPYEMAADFDTLIRRYNEASEYFNND